jgi:hypothetical protein
MSAPIRIFVGCAANNEDLESLAVLDYTLHKYASEPLQIEWMKQSHDPQSFWYGWNTVSWATPFSGFRWGIPARCNYEGRAIYLDSDMIVMDDIAKLWHEPIPGRHAIIAKGNERFCTTVFDCAKVKPYLIPFEELKTKIGAHRTQRKRIVASGIIEPFPGDDNWNCIDGEDYADLLDPRIKIHHYSAIDTQPQLKYAIPRLKKEGRAHWFKGTVKPHWRPELVELFDETIVEAVNASYLPENYSRQPFGAYESGGSQGGVFLKGGPAVRGV